MAATPTVFSMSTGSYFNDFGFDPAMDYAQVLEEARKQADRRAAPPSKGCKDNFHCHLRTARRADLVVDISCFSAHFKAADLQKSLENLKTRGSWKNSVLFWKKSHKKHKVSYSGIPTPQHPGSKRPYKQTSGPIYMDMPISCGSSRHSSGYLGGTITPTQNGEAQIPYVSLDHHDHARIPHLTAIYLVT